MENTEVSKVFEATEKRMSSKLADTALEIVRPFLDNCLNDIKKAIGTGGIVLIQQRTEDTPLSIIVLDKSKDFTIKGGVKFTITGKPDATGKKLEAITKYFTAEEFVELLVGGKMEEIGQKLTS